MSAEATRSVSAVPSDSSIGLRDAPGRYSPAIASRRAKWPSSARTCISFSAAARITNAMPLSNNRSTPMQTTNPAATKGSGTKANSKSNPIPAMSRVAHRYDEGVLLSEVVRPLISNAVGIFRVLPRVGKVNARAVLMPSNTASSVGSINACRVGLMGSLSLKDCAALQATPEPSNAPIALASAASKMICPMYTDAT